MRTVVRISPRGTHRPVIAAEANATESVGGGVSGRLSATRRRTILLIHAMTSSPDTLRHQYHSR
jgi:hypothetical protein